MSVAFVLGNGCSRLRIDPKELKNLGKIYACNAAYRDFTPDFLISVDVKMVFELNEQQVQYQMPVWTNYNSKYADFAGFNYFNPAKGWSSGPTALFLASTHEYETIYILGFDYCGSNNNTTFNNVYADTQNYKSSTQTATYYGNWYRQTESVIKDYSKISYIRVVDEKLSLNTDWEKYSNYKIINYENFAGHFGLNLQF